MHDLKLLNENPALLEKALASRGQDKNLAAQIHKLNERKKQALQQMETLRAERNKVTQEIAKLKRNKDATSQAEAEKFMQQSRKLGEDLKKIEDSLRSLESEFTHQALTLPNIPHSSVPTGSSSEDNTVVRHWGEPATFNFQVKDHVSLGEDLGLLDFERAGKISGARFSLYFGAAAALERALIQFMLDLHTKNHGYMEVIPPFMVNRNSLIGTGNLPKFEEDLFKTNNNDKELFMIPTAEVPLTNIYSEEILSHKTLPAYFTAYTPCFRSEAGSYGKDVRGLIRQHQFQKVELVKIVTPETSYEEHEKMVADAEKVLQLLELPYRVVLLCTGDMGFSAAKTYDLEVWLPSQQNYREISSCSNCEDFQARRAQIRYRPGPDEKPRFVHTLNGSGLAVGRTLIAIMENYQTESGTIRIPTVLDRYLEGSPYFIRGTKGQLEMQQRLK
ncbi:MAG: serine--tRNA ligase [Bdellovibrionales bacterium]|nr:serine--tRNA ligase [Bdellovibrionales bacterium]